MNYETPELNALTAISAIQNSLTHKGLHRRIEIILPGNPQNEISSAYTDWE